MTKLWKNLEKGLCTVVTINQKKQVSKKTSCPVFLLLRSHLQETPGLAGAKPCVLRMVMATILLVRPAPLGRTVL